MPSQASACEQRVNDTLAKVEQCINEASLWQHLERFALIADQNPGPKGHGNRDTGTTGYRASVRYVAGLMRRAGYTVTIQRYDYRKFERTDRPRLQSRGGVLAESDDGDRSDFDYNVIADSPYGDPHRVVVVDAHLDSIYGAGMLDNASGSTTILEIALAMAKTHARNRVRYVWFGGEEIGLLGSRYYTTHLRTKQLHDIAFDLDVDVTATPNFDILIADPKFAQRVKHFPPNVVPDSKVGNDLFYDYFRAAGVVSRLAWFGNDGTDSLSFSLAGTPNTGILTQQDCCKHEWERQLWGGFLGNYEGRIPGSNGGCVDKPHRWCDNLYNNDPFVLELVSKATADVAFKLANRSFPW